MKKDSKSEERRKEIQKKGDQEIIATSIFQFKELKLKDDLCWYLKLLLKIRLPQAYREYTVKISLNEAPFEMRIQDLEKKKEEIKADKQSELFPSESAKKVQLKNIDEEIKNIQEELKEALEQSSVIEFEGSLEKLEYKDSDTLIVTYIPYEVVEPINKIKSDLTRHYKIELIRE